MPTSKLQILQSLKTSLDSCTNCNLHIERKNVVFGEGNPDATIMFIGEGPGENEDNTGRPFVGRAGQLLDKILEAIGLSRPDVYIANIVKCRPPNNRVPTSVEVESCIGNLRQQISLIKPKIIIPLGMSAVQGITLNEETTMKATHGKRQVLRWEIPGYTPIVIPTYHPAALLRNDQLKIPTWEDFQLIQRLMNE